MRLNYCQKGDSGGPMIIYEENTAYQIGVTSFGDGCGKHGIPGVYAEVSNYVPWIQKMIN